MSLEAGATVFLDYGVVGEPWHERVLLAHVGDADWVVLTPDFDMFVETVAAPPLDGVRAAAVPFALPTGLGIGRGNPVYRFDPRPSEAQLLQSRAEADRMAILGRAAAEYRVVGGAVVAAADGDGAGQLVDAAERDEAGGAGGGVRHRVSGKHAVSEAVVHTGNWVVAEPDGAVPLGTVIHDSGSIVSVGSRGICRHGLGVVLLVERVSEADVAAYVERFRQAAGAGATPRGEEPAGDARTLAIHRSANGERYRDFRSLAQSIEMVDFNDWPLLGPRTAAWYITELSKTGMSPVARHSHWIHENDHKKDDPLVLQHELLSEVLEMAGSVDQLDLSNLIFAEVVVRQMQFIEAELKRRSDSAKPLDGSEYYLARTRKTGGALQAPALTEYISKRAQAEGAVLKEQRKAAEERALARPKKKPG